MSHEVYQVLLVDDDEEDYIVTQDLLSEAEQSRFKLAWVSSYQSGLAEIAKDRHHAYLLDYRLGQESGLELLREAIGLGCRNIGSTSRHDASVIFCLWVCACCVAHC